MTRKLYIPLFLLTAAAFTASAQYDQDIEVEGKYVPEIIRHDRIGLFPTPVRFPLGKSVLDYSLGGVNADFKPQLVPLSPTGWKSTRDYSDARGYIELGAGSWLESTLSAGYRFVDTESSVFGIRLQHNSTSLWKPEVSSVSPDNRQWRYDESIGLYGHHIFEGTGRLDAAVDYHIGNFNYYGSIESAPTQTLQDISARVMWHSPSFTDNVTWNLGAAVRYFGYRSIYLPTAEAGFLRASGSRETDLAILGGINFPTSQKSSLGIDLKADILTYAKRKQDGTPIAGLPADPDNYGMVLLTPYYRFSRSNVNIRLGAEIDLSFNAGPENDRYSTFHIAPDVKIDYNAGPVTLFLHALGGSSLNTLASNYELDYYQSPGVYSTTPVYSPLDSRLGISFGPFSGFHAGFDVAFRISRGQYLGGWYQTYLNSRGLRTDIEGLPVTEGGSPLAYCLTPDYAIDMHGFSLGLNLGYDGVRYFKIDAEGRYQRQDGKTGYFNGYDRPEWTADITAETNPWSTLKFRLGYSLRALRNMAVAAYDSDNTLLNGTFPMMCRLPNASMLNFGVSYGITDNFDVWAQADNLLNRRQVYLPGLPEPGIRIALGLGFRF